MLQDAPPGMPAALATRLVIEPPRAVAGSVLPDGDPDRAAAEAGSAGVPAELLARFGATVRQTHRRANVVVVDVPPDRQAALAEALRAAGIAARPPLRIRALLNDSVPLLRVPAAWAAGLHGSGVRIAIVDTGLDAAHPDFRGRVAERANFSEAGADDDVGHGTHVAGIAAGAGAVYRGVAPAATLVIAKALSVHGGTEDAVLAAMSWASRRSVEIMNLSLGGPGSPHSPLGREVDALTAEGLIVCVAAGNAGPDRSTIDSPGNARGALTVGAADKTGRLASYSSRGPVPGARYRKPDVIAIGGGVTPGATCAYGTGIASARAAVLATDPCAVPPRYQLMTGTSMATPHIAGICALLLEAIGDRGSAPRRARLVRRAVLRSARPSADMPTDADAGLVDAERALVLVSRRASETAAQPSRGTASSSPARAKTPAKLK